MNGRLMAHGFGLTAPHAVRRLAPRALLALVALTVLAPSAHAQPQEVVEYYGTDALGSVRVVFDAAGNRIARTDYVPFGEALNPTGALPSEQFTGQPREGDAGLDYFGARYYAARLGRFSTIDPIGGNAADPQSWNRYAYARNAPGTFVDPTGMEPIYCTPTSAAPSDFCTSTTAPATAGNGGTSGPGILGPLVMGCTFNPAQCGLYWDDDPGPLVWCAMYCGQGPEPIPEDDTLQIVEDIVDVISFFDPTPATSFVSGAINAKQGDTAGVALAAAGAALPAADLAKGLTSAGRLFSRLGRATEHLAGEISGRSLMDSALRWLGPAYQDMGRGRYLSADGLRQFRFGADEIKSAPYHAHFEAYDRAGGRVIENARVRVR